jgi:signal transduction histidine kinase
MAATGADRPSAFRLACLPAFSHNSHMRRLLTILLIALPLLARAADPITSIKEVRTLSRSEALAAKPVELEATVLYSDPANWGAVIDDGTASCYLSIESDARDLSLGARIRIKGITTQFGLFPHIKSRVLEIIGHSELPEPVEPGVDDLFLPSLDSCWIRVPAIVTGVESGGIAYTLVVEVFGRELKADLPLVPDADERAAALMQHPVMMTAVAGTIFNSQMQMTGRHFFVPSFDFLVPVETQDKVSDIPLVATWDLLTGTSGPTRPVRIQGVVTQGNQKGFYVRDGVGSAFVQTAMTDRFPPGTKIEATGFGNIAPYRPILRATTVSEIEKGPPPPPRPMVLDEPGLSRLHDEFVTVDAEFLGLRHGTEENVLLCRTADTFFEAISDPRRSAPAGLTIGDTIRITGICKLFTTHPIARPEWADGFRIHIAPRNPIQVLRKAPWWTKERLFSALEITGLVCVVSLLGVAYLRRRVASQMGIIGDKLRDEAVHTERDRMARELHDTLEQQLSGMALQIEGIARAASSNTEALPSRVAIARRMINHTRAEARRSVWDLRSRILENEGLAAALRAMAATVSETPGSPAVEVLIDDRLPPLSKNADFHLLRIAQEAVTNSVKHSGADKVRIELTSGPSSVILRVTDNGTGFHTSDSPDPTHFGTTGMRERAERIKARLEIHSKPGDGCSVSVEVPLPQPETSSST